MKNTFLGENAMLQQQLKPMMFMSISKINMQDIDIYLEIFVGKGVSKSLNFPKISGIKKS